MLALKPSLLIQSPVVPSGDLPAVRLERLPNFSHSHISSFRSLLLDMQIYSPSVKVVKLPGLATPRPCPVFADHDKIYGNVVLDPSCSQHGGRLTISLEGAFEYSSITDEASDGHPHNPMVKKYRRVFLSSSAAIPLSPLHDSRSTLRDALSVRKRPSMSSLNNPTQRSCEFSFELPRGSRPGEEIPPTFSCTTPADHSGRQLNTEGVEVSYRITAVWEAADGFGNQAILETPVIFQPDTDFQSVDGSAVEPQSWLEMPLMPERLIPFNCAVTLPRPQSFSRCYPIPYFVVFTTDTRSPTLIKEIAADATIVVSLIRKITVTRERTSRPLVLPDTPPASDESDSPTSPLASRLKRSFRTPMRSRSRDEFFPETMPRIEPPQVTFSTSRTLKTEVSIGFPKRPRSSDGSLSLPDGLYKGKVQLSKDMLPSVEWPGISVKYFLDVSILVGQDTLRSRFPIRVY